MDKKDDNKKPSKKDKKKDKKDKKDKKKKVVKKKSDDKISQSQIVNIKIGDISKPKTRRRAAPKAPPPPQIQRQLQYLPSLAGQAPMIPPPLTPAPTPPPAPPRPPAPAAPAAEPIRTGDFFSDASKFGTSYDLSSATLDDLTSVGRAASRPSMSRAFNRPRSDSTVSALTEPTYADLDFDNFSDFNATAPSRFGSSYDLQTTAPPQNVELLGQFSDRTQGAETQDSVIGKLAYDYDMPFVENLEDFDLKEPRLRLQGVTQSSGEEEEQIIRTVRPMKDDDSVATQFRFNLSQSTQPEESLGAGADFENIAAPSVVSVSDNLGFVSSQQAQPQDLQFTSSNTPTAQPILGMLPDPQPQDLVLSSQKPKELKIPKPASDAAEERPATEPITEVSAIIEPVITTPDKGYIRPEDEATGGGGGGKKESIIFSELSDKKLSKLFKIFENERRQMQLTQADAIERYNLIKKTGGLISTKQFSLAYTKYKKQQEAAEEE